MFFYDDETGDITLTQGDSGEYFVSGLPTDQSDYVLYFNVQDEKRRNIGQEVSLAVNGASEATIKLTGDYTDGLRVKANEEFTTYNFGIKICSETADTEETLILGNKEYDDLNVMTVYPKKVEGV